jgi:hypothetical protein
VGLKTLSYNATIYTTTWSYIKASDSATTSSYTEWNTTSVTTSVETVFIKQGTLEAEPFIVRFREADFPTNNTTSPSQSSATSSEAATTASSRNDPGLATGVKAGIGVGAALGALLLVGIGLGVFWLRRKKSRNNDKKAIGTPTVQNSEVDESHAPSELPTKWSTAELHAQPTPSKELQASQYREVNPDEPAELADVSMSGR